MLLEIRAEKQLLVRRSFESVKYLRLAITIAVSVAMMMPTAIFAECCCRSAKAECCAVETSAEVLKTNCCSCEQIQVDRESSRECVTPEVGSRVRPSCECCLRDRMSPTSLPVRFTKDVVPQSILGQQPPIDCVLQQSSAKYIETTLPVFSHNKRQALLCVWIH
jgi:hypothetical protein